MLAHLKTKKMKPIASILICTIEGRESFLDGLLFNIAQQMKKYNLTDGVDFKINISKDKRGEHSIGDKRNALLQSCDSEYACFIDDDDQISDTYLYNALQIMKTQKPDCINLIGQMTVLGGTQTFIHELKQKEYVTTDGVHYRPPNHLNFIKTSISKKFTFPSINHGEDTDWAMQICRASVLKTEGRIESVSYFYLPSEIHKN